MFKQTEWKSSSESSDLCNISRWNTVNTLVMDVIGQQSCVTACETWMSLAVKTVISDWCISICLGLSYSVGLCIVK